MKGQNSGFTIKESDVETIVFCPSFQFLVHFGRRQVQVVLASTQPRGQLVLQGLGRIVVVVVVVVVFGVHDLSGLSKATNITDPRSLGKAAVSLSSSLQSPSRRVAPVPFVPGVFFLWQRNERTKKSEFVEQQARWRCGGEVCNPPASPPPHHHTSSQKKGRPISVGIQWQANGNTITGCTVSSQLWSPPQVSRKFPG